MRKINPCPPKDPGTTVDVERLRPITCRARSGAPFLQPSWPEPPRRSGLPGGVSGRDVFSSLRAIKEDIESGKHAVAFEMDLALRTPVHPGLFSLVRRLE